ncbi:phage late control D family protein [Tardiphaga sp. 71_E8_N1_1]|uniref:phage late control D family protein n=1 Tax=Tardiphaga sp. 71_E8_N1_1 TaxID=3240784 RepID=UPI003F8B5DD3
MLESLTVSDKEGTTSDTASITLDDSDAQIAMPRIGDPMTIALGWEETGISRVFDGTVDDPRSTGSRSEGRKLIISAKGFDPKGKAKEPLEFHKDEATLEEFMSEAASKAGLTMRVYGKLASIKRPYWSAGTESFIHLGQRIAREVGGNFKIYGKTGIITEKNAGMSVSGRPLASVTATWGDNLLDWDITPSIGRPRFQQARARFYDIQRAKWMEGLIEIPGQGASSDATHTHRQTRADEDEAKSSASDNSKSSEKERGGGPATIVGNPAAQPAGTCIVAGARPGVDGSYKIESVDHTLTRSDGYKTKLELKHPEGDVGTDSRS